MKQEENKKDDNLKKFRDYIDRVENLSDVNKNHIKDAIGCNLENLPDRILVPFYNTAPKIWDNDPETAMAYLFAATVYCNLGTSDVSFQERLREIYQDEDTSDSMKADIEKIIALYWDETGSMARHLQKYVSMLKREDKPFDVARFLRDLCYWNNENRISKITWARRISSIVPEKKENKKEEIEL